MHRRLWQYSAMLQASDLLELPRAERVKCMEVLWDSLISEEKIQSPEWHDRILASRLASAAKGEARFVPLEELRQRLKQ
jgi:putative addiction module component (TIGR02574 family)